MNIILGMRAGCSQFSDPPGDSTQCCQPPRCHGTVPSSGGCHHGAPKLHGLQATMLLQQSRGAFLGAARRSFGPRGAAEGLSPVLQGRGHVSCSVSCSDDELALLTAEGWEAGGDGEKPGPREVYLRTTMLQSKMKMCFLREAAGRDSTGGQDGRGRVEHVASAGGYCGGRREGAVPSQNRGLWQSAARHPPVRLPAPCWVPVCRGAVPEGRGRLPSREVGGGDASSFPG